MLLVLSQFCRAEAAALYLVRPGNCRVEAEGRHAGRKASTDRGGIGGNRRPLAAAPGERALSGARAECGELALRPSWRGLYTTCWSVPLVFEGRLAGVMQFGFTRLLRVASERSGTAFGGGGPLHARGGKGASDRGSGGGRGSGAAARRATAGGRGSGKTPPQHRIARRGGAVPAVHPAATGDAGEVRAPRATPASRRGWRRRVSSPRRPSSKSAG